MDMFIIEIDLGFTLNHGHWVRFFNLAIMLDHFRSIPNILPQRKDGRLHYEGYEMRVPLYISWIVSCFNILGGLD